jgi:hypothetical protein
MGNIIKPIILTHEHLNDFIEKSDKNSSGCDNGKNVYLQCKWRQMRGPTSPPHLRYCISSRKQDMYFLYHLVNKPTA